MSSLGYVFGFIGAALMVASYLMKNMLPLRMVALSANVFLVIYALQGGSWPTVALYVAMIPINIKKVHEILKLVRAIENAKADSPAGEWLLPHMTRRQAKAGDSLWRKGDVATEMLFVESGQLKLLEHDALIGPGSIIGEIGLFAPDNRRTGSVNCATDCTLYSLSAEGMAKLYFQNPRLGYHVMRLIVARLMHDVEIAAKRREDSAQITAATAPPAAA